MNKVYSAYNDYNDYGDLFFRSTLSNFIIENELCVGDLIREGVERQPSASMFFDIDSILDNANEQALDECGDSAESFANLSKEKRDDFEKLIHDWVDKNIEVDFFVVEDIKDIVITKDMLELNNE